MSKEKATSAVKDQVNSFVSGGFGGICLVAAGHPLDLIKVRLQTSNQYSGIADCVKKTVAKDGIKGLYRGMAAPLVGVTPIFAICFWGYDQGKSLVRWAYGTPENQPLDLMQLSIAGGYSALPTTLVMVPAERIKCILQIQGQEGQVQYKGPLDAAKGIWREGGIRALYKGTAATLLRDVPGSTAYFGVYEAFKRGLSQKDSNKLNPLAVIFAGGMAGIANWSVAIPADVIKSRLQTAPAGTYTGMTDCIRQLLKNEGPSALFRGLGPAMLRAFPANAACFLGVEVAIKVLNSLW